ncbi:hypothetical protein ABZ312_04340 [Streptomyces sp. NPDC006207]
MAFGGARTAVGRFALFAECLLTGVWLVAAALPLVTALAAFAAACGHLRRHLDGERSTWRDFMAETAAATRAGWRCTLLWWGGLALLGLDLAVARSGMPAGGAFTCAGVLAAVVLVVTGIRAAALWRPGESGRGAAGRAVRRVVGDPGGTLLLVGGVVVVGVAAWMLLPLGAVALGCVAGAAVAVERRSSAGAL